MSETKENIVLVKSYDFALKIVKLCRQLQREEKEYNLTGQLCRSATSIGANAEEAMGGYSRKEFAHKLGISYKEARESKYWLRLLGDAEIIGKKDADLLIHDADELAKILFSIIRSSNERLN